MKKILLTIALTVLGTVAANAQFSVNAGMDFATTRTQYTTGNYESDPYTGFFVGANYNFLLDDICTGLGVKTGLDFIFNGSKYNDEIFTEKYSEGILSVPVAITYTKWVGDFAIRPYAGVSFDYGLYCNSKYTASAGSLSAKADTNWYDDYYKRFGTDFICGLDVILFDNFMISASFYQGFVNMSKMDTFTSNSHGFQIGIGYVFD